MGVVYTEGYIRLNAHIKDLKTGLYEEAHILVQVTRIS